MKKEHFGFLVFLIALLLTPKVHIPFAGIAEKSAISLGAFGLTLWLLLTPISTISLKPIAQTSSVKILIVFSTYALGISIYSLNEVSILYAAQYFVYVLITSLVLGSYVQKARAMKQTKVIYKIFAMVGALYVFGVLVSLWTGPIYPHQTLYVARRWAGVYLRQGVGFAEGGNMAGAVLIFLNSFYWFIYRHYSRYWWIFSIFTITALLITLSRSAISSYLFVVGIVGIVGLSRSIIAGRMSRPVIRLIKRIAIGLALIIPIGYAVLTVAERPRTYIKTALEGFGINDQSRLLSQARFDRLSLWTNGIETWASGSTFDKIFGRGFRESFDLSSDNSAWITQHNAYIAFLSDFGLTGTILFVSSLLTALLRAAINWIRSRSSIEERAALVGIAAMMIHNISEVFFYSPVIISMLLIMLMLIKPRNSHKNMILPLGSAMQDSKA